MSELRQRNGNRAAENKLSQSPTPDNRKQPSVVRSIACCCVVFVVAASLLLVLTAISLRSPAPSVNHKDIEAAGNNWVRLEDGRLLEYSKCGDFSGQPVYTATGYASTANLFTAPWMCKLAAKYGLWFISISMPGFGLSDSMPLGFARSLVDWPADVFAVLKKEGVDRFGVMGASTGCVHGAAVAHAAPNKVVSLMLLTPTAPQWVESQSSIAKETAFIKSLMMKPYVGDLLGKLMSLMSARTRMNAAPDIKMAMDKMFSLGGQYTEVLEAYAIDNERSTVHTYRGWPDNMHTIAADVPFSLKELGDQLKAKGVKIAISSSPDDTTNPPAMQEWFHSQIPGSQLIQVAPGFGHLHLIDPTVFDRVCKFLKTGEY